MNLTGSKPNKALHWTAIPLRFIAASELGRSAACGELSKVRGSRCAFV
jgi:hypothetical protein